MANEQWLQEKHALEMNSMQEKASLQQKIVLLEKNNQDFSEQLSSTKKNAEQEMKKKDQEINHLQSIINDMEK